MILRTTLGDQLAPLLWSAIPCGYYQVTVSATPSVWARLHQDPEFGKWLDALLFSRRCRRGRTETVSESDPVYDLRVTYSNEGGERLTAHSYKLETP